ncbi:MAG: hypothetical protein CMN56_02645 [Sneathiella sp.]|nr:hypothetical protein [Sneathiella sp.]|tara:strand:- start:287 stop:469 length:183 start_codon:yes stop_codon:yes gene_type:complete
MTYSNFEETDIQAYVDNMLEPRDADRIKKIITHNPEAKRQYLKLLQQNQLLRTWWQKSMN